MSAASWATPAAGAGAAAGAVLGVLLVAFVVGRARGRYRVIDVAWGIGFAAVALVELPFSGGHGDPLRRALLCALTVAWGLRLAAHLAHRAWGAAEDPRYARMVARASGNPTWYALRTFALLQAALVWLISLPVQAGQYLAAPVGPLAWVGVAVWLCGMLFEAVGDAQLARFTRRKGHGGAVLDHGLWRYTRHPNYFGDACVWWGLYLLAVDPVGEPWGALGLLVSPAVMTLLLTVGSGKRLLEERLRDRPGYRAYAARTSGFVPLPPRRDR